MSTPSSRRSTWCPPVVKPAPVLTKSQAFSHRRRFTPMHELSIAATVMEKVLEFVETRGVSKVVCVRLAIGELTCIQHGQLKFCYESVARETPLADSTLEIETVPARVT